ncbi:MAG: error-prone polymerase [Thermomicrobiales bacterium]|nr:error-prone polymerase [Thermomicrobiales bacterium]
MADKVEYVELHLHTAFSFLDGASLPDELVGRAVELGYRALAVTDHDGLYGAMEFALAAKGAGIAPITGAEVTLTDGTHLTLLAETQQGYANLCRLITAAHHAGLGSSPHPPVPSPDHGRGGDGDRSNIPFELRGIGKSKPLYRPEDRTPRLDPALIPGHAEGLILLTGCRQGRLSQFVDADQRQEAEALLRDYVNWFGKDNVVVELQQNRVYGDGRRTQGLVHLAEHLGLPYAATGNVHYHRQERHRLQDVLVAIKHRTTLDHSHRERRPNAQFYLRSAEEMGKLFERYPAALTTTGRIAERCAKFDLTRDLDYAFPDYPTENGETPGAMLARVCRKALAERYSEEQREAAERRLCEELAVIERHKLGGFFLLYRDLLLLAREVADEVRGVDSARSAANLPPGRGRGSSVSSIVCYLIGLSHIDPVKNNLFFGRFLNEEMYAVPDIDLDFPREIRERLIERVHEKYADRAALVCAFSTYKLRSAVRDVGKALGLPQPDIDKIAKLSEPRSAHDLSRELDRIPGYAERKDNPPWSHLVELADQLAGFPRHVTQHVGGMVVAAGSLCQIVPVQPAAMEGRFLCQWDKDSCDDARMVKIDFLALGMLSLVEECLELIAASTGKTVDLSRINFNDPEVYEMICKGDTVGVFQIESRAQIQMLPRTRPKSLDDLAVQVAIVRPGPIIGGAVTPYVAHRQQERTSFLPIEPQYDHECLKEVLAETHGVVLFQEQVLQVAMAYAGFTPGEAEGFRRAMSRKRSQEAMAALKEKFIAGAVAKHQTTKHQVTHAEAEKVFTKLAGFASYGFPKAHATAFALLAYQSCWLKHYYPAEFTCALLNNQPMGFYPPHVLINDAKRHKLRVLAPDVNLSGVRCNLDGGNGIRIGLGYVKELGEEPAQRIVLEREANGQYRSLADLVRRVPLPTAAVENLIAVGAFDRFGLGRREALWQLGLFIPSQRFGTKQTTANGRQIPLALPVGQDGVELRPMGAWDQMAADYAVLGLSPRYHPLGLLRWRLPQHFVTVADLERLPHGAEIEIAGLTVCRQRPGTAKGITFLLLEDEHGLVNVIVYPDLYERQRMVVRGEPFIVVTGTLQKQNDTINVITRQVRPLENARQEFAAAPARDLDDVTAPFEPERERELATVSPESHNYR